MSYFTLIGARCFISQTDPKAGTAKAISSITNDDPPEVTATAHGYSNNDEILLDVGWEDFGGSIFRVDNVATNSYELPGYDSTDTDFFPQGDDEGNGYKITDWVSIGQILKITDEGGNPTSIQLRPYEKRNGIKLFTGFDPSGLTFELGFDRSLPAQQYMEKASRVLGKRAVKFILGGPTYFYGYGTVGMSPLPKFDDVLKRLVNLSFDGLFTGF